MNKSGFGKIAKATLFCLKIKLITQYLVFITWSCLPARQPPQRRMRRPSGCCPYNYHFNKSEYASKYTIFCVYFIRFCFVTWLFCIYPHQYVLICFCPKFGHNVDTWPFSIPWLPSEVKKMFMTGY